MQIRTAVLADAASLIELWAALIFMEKWLPPATSGQPATPPGRLTAS